MGTTPSKEIQRWSSSSNNYNNSNNSRQNTNDLLSQIFLPSHLRLVRCDAPAPPPLPPIGGNSTTTLPKPESTPPPPPPSTTESPPPPPAAAPEEDSISQAAQAVSAVPNPGPYEGAMMPIKRLTNLDTHDGIRCDIQKQLSPYMVAIHSFWLGTSMLPDGRNKTYSFVTQVADENGLLMARIDPEKGSVDGRIHRALLGGLAQGKVQIGVSAGEGEQDQVLGEIDFGGMTWTGNLKYGSMGGGIVFGANYYQSINEKWAMGGEGMYISANQNLLSTYTVKYETAAKSGAEEESGDKSAVVPAEGSSLFVGQFNPAQGMLNLNYRRVVTPNRVTLGAELQCSPVSLDSQVVFGAEFQLTRSKFGVTLDGSGKIQSVLEAKLGMAPGSPTLNFSADVDHAKDTMRFGYGLNIGG